MNLVIDVGNTDIKLGIFDENQLIDNFRTRPEGLYNLLKRIIDDYKRIEAVIFSSVGSLDKSCLTFLQSEDLLIMELSHELNLPFTNLYKTPTTLGVDRIALVAAAVYNFSGKNTLIIDAGTCITYDFKDVKENYLGGAISPGIGLRYSSLHNYTAKLPLLDKKAPNSLVGTSTDEAIHSGIINGVISEIDGIIERYCNTYNDLTVILTGGDAHFLSKRLKNSIFATSNFLLEGLNYILGINKDK